jgi:hypothetical protein
MVKKYFLIITLSLICSVPFYGQFGSSQSFGSSPFSNSAFGGSPSSPGDPGGGEDPDVPLSDSWLLFLLSGSVVLFLKKK